MPNSPAATPAGSPFQFTPFPFGPPPQPAVTPPVTPSYTGTAPAGTQMFYSSAQFQTVVAADNGSTLQIGAVTGLPQRYPFKLLLEWGTANQEVVVITSAPTGNGPYTFTGVLRGQDGGAPQITHSAGAQVNHGVSAADFFQIAPVFNICDTQFAGGADPTGTLWSDPAIQAAFNACVAAGAGTIAIPPGNYKTQQTAGGNINGAHVAIYAAPGAIIYYYGSGDCISFYDASNFSNRYHAIGTGIFGSLTIDGTNSSSNAASTGLHIGDIFQLNVQCTAKNFSNFPGSIGIHFDNQYFFTEQMNARVWAANNYTNVMFDNSAGSSGTATGSFDRCVVLVGVETLTGIGGDGVTFNNGAQLNDGQLSIYGNFGTAVAQYAVLKLTGSDTIGPSAITQSVLNIGVELDDASFAAPYTINFANSNSQVFNCTGNLDFTLSGTFTASNNSGNFRFIGEVQGDSALPVFLPFGRTNIADGNQAVSATTPTAITNITAPVAAFAAYKVDMCIPHTGAGTSGTFTFAWSGPSINAASLDIQVWTGTTLTAHTINGSSATIYAAAPSASARSIIITGTIVLASAGTLGITGNTTAGGSAVTVDAGAYLAVQQISAP